MLRCPQAQGPCLPVRPCREFEGGWLSARCSHGALTKTPRAPPRHWAGGPVTSSGQRAWAGTVSLLGRRRSGWPHAFSSPALENIGAWGQPEPDESLIPESLVGGEPLPTYAGHSARMRKGLRGCRTPSEGAAACCRGAAPNRSPCLRSLAANAGCKRNWETGSASNWEGRKRAGWGAWSWQRPLGRRWKRPTSRIRGQAFHPGPLLGKGANSRRGRRREWEVGGVGSPPIPGPPARVNGSSRETPDRSTAAPLNEQLATEAGRVPRGHVAIDCRCISAVARASSETVCLADSQAAAFLSITAGC